MSFFYAILYLAVGACVVLCGIMLYPFGHEIYTAIADRRKDQLVRDDVNDTRTLMFNGVPTIMVTSTSIKLNRDVLDDLRPPTAFGSGAAGDGR